MDVAELRIGNLVDRMGIELSIVSIDSERFFEDKNTRLDVAIRLSDQSAPWLNHLKPIPITEEWVNNLGFDNTTDDNDLPEGAELLVFFKEKYSIEIIPDALGIKSEYIFAIYENVVDVYGNYALQGVYEIEIEYVHQLQNLYFALTGEELTLAPEK